MVLSSNKIGTLKPGGLGGTGPACNQGGKVRSTLMSKPFNPLSGLPTVADLFVDELAVHGLWLVASVTGSIYWTLKVQKARYRGLDIFALPATKEGSYPALAVRMEKGLVKAEVRHTISSFLSALCWLQGGGAGALIKYWTEGNLPRPAFGFSDRMIRTAEFELDYLPDPPERASQLALALCREAGGVNTAAAATVAYTRVFELHLGKSSKPIKSWINANLGAISDHNALAIRDELYRSHQDIGHYLYDSCRSAAVHASIGRVIIDPDDPADERRLQHDLPLLRELAIKLTEDNLGVQTRHTVYKEHLYELAGFKAVLGDALVARLINGDPLAESETIELPVVNVGLMDRPAYPALCNLQPVECRPIAGGLQIVFEHAGGLLKFRVNLDFKAERLHFDLFNDLKSKDDGTAAAAEIAADAAEFSMWYFGNGRLRIDDAEGGGLLSRKEAYVPHNMFQDRNRAQAEIDRWRAEAERRSLAWGRTWTLQVCPDRVAMRWPK
jgi:hypothetical protein